MSYLPPPNLNHPTETEELSGRRVNNSESYVKILKIAGTVGTGNVNLAHGVTGMTRLLSAYGGAHLTDGREIPIPYSGASSTYVISLRGNGTTNDILITVGTGWGTLITDLWLVIEYLK